LHAREIVVPLYKNRAPIRVSAPVPPHMRDALLKCGWEGEEQDAPGTPYIHPCEAGGGQKSGRQ
jgi:hypothetical protein